MGCRLILACGTGSGPVRLDDLAEGDLLDLVRGDSRALEGSGDGNATELGRIDRGKAPTHLAKGVRAVERMTVRGIYGLSKIEEIDVYGRYRGTAKLGYLDSVHMKAYLRLARLTMPISSVWVCSR